MGVLGAFGAIASAVDLVLAASEVDGIPKPTEAIVASPQLPTQYVGACATSEGKAIAHCSITRFYMYAIYQVIGAAVVIFGESRLKPLLEIFPFVATFKGRAFTYLLLGVFCIGSNLWGLIAGGYCIFLFVISLIIGVKFGKQLEQYQSV